MTDFSTPKQQEEGEAKQTAKELVGLWEAKRRFGPDVRGNLFIRKMEDGVWEAEIAGYVAQVQTAGESISFELPDRQNKFQGKFDARREKIIGHWIQPAIPFESGVPYASPVTLRKDKQNAWLGEVASLGMTLTFYLKVEQREDGSVGAFLRNPERNLGWFQLRADHIEREGNVIKLRAASRENEKGRVLAEGRYDPDAERLSIYFPNRGGTFDFQRLTDDETSDFYPRGRPTVTYRYSPPPTFDDGWQTASLEDVGISRVEIEKFIQMVIDTPMNSSNSQEDHGILIARGGKLVLEEYFHGENREKPHDTRSASKSVASDLMGAAMQAGIPIRPASFVFQVMNGGEFPEGLAPRQRALTVEHLLTMSSGFDCDDNDPNSPGYEDNMWEQTEQPDFYKWTMDLEMIREPGEKAVYCSANANLVGGILKRASGTPLPELFHTLLAEPLNIKRYYLPLSPTGDYTMTGGARFLPRDFMKLAQLHLNGGTWNDRRIFSTEWSRRATSPLYHLDDYKLDYGYLWWVKEYPHNGRNIQAYFAAGNGGQIAMAIPDLDLVLGFYAGNYNDVGGKTATNIYVPEYILPAVDK